MGTPSDPVALSQRVTFSKKFKRIKIGFAQIVRLSPATGKSCQQGVLK